MPRQDKGQPKDEGKGISDDLPKATRRFSGPCSERRPKGEGTQRLSAPVRVAMPRAGSTSQLVRPDALNVFGFGTFFAGNDVKRHFISFVQGLETLADDGGVVNEDVLA